MDFIDEELEFWHEGAGKSEENNVFDRTLSSVCDTFSDMVHLENWGLQQRANMEDSMRMQALAEQQRQMRSESQRALRDSDARLRAAQAVADRVEQPQSDIAQDMYMSL